MSINFLRLNNFRIFQKITLEFEKPLIFIHGNNRSGKTSIIEAIYIILNNRSFRCDSLAGCVKN
ncbi:MAG TPA: AAA family ATPase, partial [Exilispira sp.]|nr:AAA family ATPase [Exilispira sp.]